MDTSLHIYHPSNSLVSIDISTTPKVSIGLMSLLCCVKDSVIMYPRLHGILWDMKMSLEVDCSGKKYCVLHQVGFCFQIILVAFATVLMEKVSPARQAC